jgi:ribose transport system substrate-binding protein
MKLSRTFLIAGAFLTLALFPSCGGSGSTGTIQKAPQVKGDEKVKIAIVTNNPEAFWTICQAGAEKAAKEHNVELIFRKPEKGDVVVQMDIVNALVNQGIHGIAISVIDPLEQTPELKRIAKKVHLVTMDNDAEKSDRLCYVGTDNYEAGKAVGKLVKEAMPNGGTIAIFVGQITPINARQRFQGVVDELAGEKDAKGPMFGKYKLHRGEAITDGANRENAQNNTKTVLEQIVNEPNVCLIGLWAYNPPAILEATRSKGLAGKVKIVGFDEDSATLSAIESGEIYATVVQDPFNFGVKSVEVLAAVARGDKSKLLKEAVPHRIVTKDGIDPATKKKDRDAAGEFAKHMKALLASVK